MSTIHRPTDGLIIMVSPSLARSHGRVGLQPLQRSYIGSQANLLSVIYSDKERAASGEICVAALYKARWLCDGRSDNGPIKSCAQRKVCRRFYADDRLRSPCYKDANRRVAVINCRLDYCQPCTQRQSNSLSQLCRLSTRFEPTVK